MRVYVRRSGIDSSAWYVDLGDPLALANPGNAKAVKAWAETVFAEDAAFVEWRRIDVDTWEMNPVYVPGRN